MATDALLISMILGSQALGCGPIVEDAELASAVISFDATLPDGRVVENIFVDDVTPAADGTVTFDRTTSAAPNPDAAPMDASRFLGMIPLSTTAPSWGIDRRVRSDERERREALALRPGQKAFVRYDEREAGTGSEEIGRYEVTLLRCGTVTVDGTHHPTHVYELTKARRRPLSNRSDENGSDAVTRKVVHLSDRHLWPLRVESSAYTMSATHIAE